MSNPTGPVKAVGLSEVLHRLSACLDQLSVRTHAIELAVGKQLCAASPPPAKTITQLQSLDYLRQSLEDLAVLTSLLGATDTPGPLSQQIAREIDAKLKLTDTKALIHPVREKCKKDKENKPFGDLDLF